MSEHFDISIVAVAISQDEKRVIGIAASPAAVIEKAQGAGHKNVSVLRAADNYGGFVSAE